MANTHAQPFSQVLGTARFIDMIVSGWTDEYRENWAATYPDSVNLVVDDYGFCLLTHPGFISATPEDQQEAKDIFASHWDNLGEYVTGDVAEPMLTELVNLGMLDSASAVVNNLSDEAETYVNPSTWSQTIDAVYWAGEFDPALTDQSEALIRDIMENLNGNTLIGIEHLADVNFVSQTMQQAAMNGDLNVVDAIIDNLSDEAETYVNPSTWVDVIFWTYSYSLVNGAEAVDLLNNIMENLGGNQLAHISDLVVMDAGIVLTDSLGGMIPNIAFGIATEVIFSNDLTYITNQADMIRAIVNNLDDQAETLVNPEHWSGTISNLMSYSDNVPMSDQKLEIIKSLIDDIMSNLADNTLAEISDLVDMTWISQDFEYIAQYGLEFGQEDLMDAVLNHFSNVDLQQLDIAGIESHGTVDIGTNGSDYMTALPTGVEAAFGLDGSDFIYGNTGDNKLFGGDGNDYVFDFAGGENEIHGGNGNDYLYDSIGGELFGGAGDDVLYIGSGDNVMAGGEGTDTYLVFGTVSQFSGNTNVITDFSTTEGDNLDLNWILSSGYDPVQDAIEDFIILTDNGTDTLVSVDVDGTGAGQVAHDLVLLEGVTGASIEDIVNTDTLV